MRKLMILSTKIVNSKVKKDPDVTKSETDHD